jgi:hypothetical protein
MNACRRISRNDKGVWFVEGHVTRAPGSILFDCDRCGTIDAVRFHKINCLVI